LIFLDKFAFLILEFFGLILGDDCGSFPQISRKISQNTVKRAKIASEC
jgi:hypothetical protein